MQPFPSFSMQLPDDIQEDHDSADVASYWMPGDGCLLQISCFRRDTGPQVFASERISERMKKGGSWKPFDLPSRIDGCDASATRTVDDSGISWVHVYLVWPWLSVHVTVSRQGDLSTCAWAWEAVRPFAPSSCDEGRSLNERNRLITTVRRLNTVKGISGG